MKKGLDMPEIKGDANSHLFIGGKKRSDYLVALDSLVRMFEEPNNDNSFYESNSIRPMLPYLDYTKERGILDEGINIDERTGFPAYNAITNVTLSLKSDYYGVRDQESRKIKMSHLLEDAKEKISRGLDVEPKADMFKHLEYYSDIFDNGEKFPKYREIQQFDDSGNVKLMVADYNAADNRPRFWELNFKAANFNNPFNKKEKQAFLGNTRWIFSAYPDSSSQKRHRNPELDDIINRNLYFEPGVMWHEININFPKQIESLHCTGLEAFYFTEEQDFDAFGEIFNPFPKLGTVKKKYGFPVFLLERATLINRAEAQQKYRFYSP